MPDLEAALSEQEEEHKMVSVSVKECKSEMEESKSADFSDHKTLPKFSEILQDDKFLTTLPKKTMLSDLVRVIAGLDPVPTSSQRVEASQASTKMLNT